MVRVLVLLVVGGLALAMYLTKPSVDDYRAKLEVRAEALQAQPSGIVSHVQGDPLDHMVATLPPDVLVGKTTVEDYFVFTIFTTDYEHPEWGRRRVRTFGLFSTLLAYKADENR